MRLMGYLGVGHADVDKFLRGLTVPQLREWMYFWELEPFGALQAGEYAGQTVAAIINANPFKKKRGTLRSKDVYTFLGEAGESTRPTAEQLQMKVEHLVAAFGGKLEKAQ